MSWSDVLTILKQTVTDWNRDKAPRLGAALAFYSVLSLAPLLVIVLAIAGSFFGEEAARGEIVMQIEGMVGRQGAKAIEDLIAHSHYRREGRLAAALGTITLLVGASGVFGELQDSMNTIWKVQAKPGRGIWNIIRERFLSFAMVLGTAFLLIVSLVASAVLAALGKYMANALQGYDRIFSLLEMAVSFIVLTILFGLIFKVVPDVKIGWRDTFLGAILTALLFTLGKFLLGVYIGRSGIASSYGAAGSLVVLVVWIYYSAQILYLGAELTQAFTHHFRPRVPPSDNAEEITEERPLWQEHAGARARAKARFEASAHHVDKDKTNSSNASHQLDAPADIHSSFQIAWHS